MTENATQPAATAQNTAAENPESLLQIRFVPEFKAAAAARRLNARAPESHLATVRRARKINRILGETYPYAVAELDFDTPSSYSSPPCSRRRPPTCASTP